MLITQQQSLEYLRVYYPFEFNPIIYYDGIWTIKGYFQFACKVILYATLLCVFCKDLIARLGNDGVVTMIVGGQANSDMVCLVQEFQFCTRTLLPVLGDDALLSSHPIIQTVETPDQINSIFDKIAYNKV